MAMTKAKLLRTVLVALLCASAGTAQSAARVESFSPTGYAKDVRQVAVRFSENMVALGDPQQPDPFTVDCEVPGSGRWVDERHWAYDFDYDMPGAVRCRLVLRDDVRTLAGEHVQGAPEYTFHSGGPTIVDWEPYSGRRIDERQVFLLALDAEAEARSVRANARCRIARSEASRPVDLVQGAERAAILDALQGAGYYRLHKLADAVGHRLPAAEIGRPLPLAAEAEKRTRVLERIVMLRCVDPLPAGSEVDLIWGAGIAGVNGMATARDQVRTFRVRADFEARLACTAKYEGRCVDGVHIQFTAPVRRELADALRLLDENGDVLAARMDDDPQIERIDYPDAFGDQTSYRAELIAPITDIDGRPLANAADFPATIRLGRLPPGASFGYLRVVDRRAGAVAPVLLRRVEQPVEGRQLAVAGDTEIAAWLRRLEEPPAQDRDRWVGSMSQRSLLADVEPASTFTLSPGTAEDPYRLAGVALPGPGFHVVELELPPEGNLPPPVCGGSRRGDRSGGPRSLCGALVAGLGDETLGRSTGRGRGGRDQRRLHGRGRCAAGDRCRRVG